MISWHDARRLAFDAGAERVQASESVAVSAAGGRTLARAIVALTALPGHDSSAMDGWAVAGEPPWTLDSPILAGDAPSSIRLLRGHARSIATGGPVPRGADGILRSEHGAMHAEGDRVWLERAATARPDEPRPGEHVRPEGEEAARGDILVPPARRMTAPRVALAAAAGLDTVAVAAEPEVDLVVLGQEVVRSGIALPGLVRDVFTPQLPGVFAFLGCRTGTLRHADDDFGSTAHALDSSQASLLVTTGGSSRGPADFVRAALADIGARFIIDGVDVRPGHPLMLAERPDGRLILCLPGNPLAAMLSVAGIGRAVVDGMLGREWTALSTDRTAIEIPSRSAKTRLVAARVTIDGLVPTGYDGVGMLRGLADADVVAVIPAVGASPGSIVETLPLPW